jgi:uncharacterized alpha-E superfamily protein
MLARLAESLYWIARDIERADTYARLLEVSHAMTLEGDGDDRHERHTVWEPLVEITGDLERFLQRHRRADDRSVAWFLSFSSDNPNSVSSCLGRARRNAHSVRDLLPTDVWEALNSIYLELRSWSPGRIVGDGVFSFSRIVRRGSMLLQGMVDQGMRHDAAWHFLRLGRFLERAEKSARLLEVKFHLMHPVDPLVSAPAELHQWRSLLRSTGADEAYLRLTGGLDPKGISRFLVVDHRFPRSVAYCLDEVADSVDALVAHGAMREGAEPVGLVARARDELGSDGRLAWDGGLPGLLDLMQQRCNEIDRAVAWACFAYPTARDGGGVQRAQAVRQAQN